ncbi:MAG: C2H2-type zinc finger protein [Candidatus Nitrosopolaris sp.]
MKNNGESKGNSSNKDKEGCLLFCMPSLFMEYSKKWNKRTKIVTRLQSINKTMGNGLLEMSSTSSPSYRCETCGRSFNWLQELEQHKRQEHQK